jgi:hypothetical protein
LITQQKECSSKEMVRYKNNFLEQQEKMLQLSKEQKRIVNKILKNQKETTLLNEEKENFEIILLRTEPKKFSQKN